MLRVHAQLCYCYMGVVTSRFGAHMRSQCPGRESHKAWAQAVPGENQSQRYMYPTPKTLWCGRLLLASRLHPYRSPYGCSSGHHFRQEGEAPGFGSLGPGLRLSGYHSHSHKAGCPGEVRKMGKPRPRCYHLRSLAPTPLMGMFCEGLQGDRTVWSGI